MLQDDFKYVLEWSVRHSVYVFCQEEPWEAEAIIKLAANELGKDPLIPQFCLLDLRTCHIQKTEIQNAFLKALKPLKPVASRPPLYERKIREEVWAKLLQTKPSCIIVLGAERLTPKWLHYVYDVAKASYTTYATTTIHETDQTLLICCSKKKLNSFLKNNPGERICFRPARCGAALVKLKANGEEL